jgi:hypothetical protein
MGWEITFIEGVEYVLDPVIAKGFNLSSNFFADGETIHI